MTLVTRKPSGVPPWPVLLIAGAEKSGKSWACAQASMSNKIGRTLWVSVGESDPDQYGAIPGADFEIVEHDKTLNGILAVLVEIASLPVQEKPTLLVVDSMTRLWDMVTEYAQKKAKERLKEGSKKEAVITMDLWNRAKGFWAHVVHAILAHDGPVLLTARLEPVTVLDANGKPTPLKADKIKTEKNLPYDVDGVIEMPERGTVFLSGVRSVPLNISKRTDMSKNFTIDGLWDSLGLQTTMPRRVSNPDLDPEAVSTETQPYLNSPAIPRPAGAPENHPNHEKGKEKETE